jgi:hypothetical protein
MFFAVGLSIATLPTLKGYVNAQTGVNATKPRAAKNYALLDAVSSRNHAEVSRLLKEGADPNARDTRVRDFVDIPSVSVPGHEPKRFKFYRPELALVIAVQNRDLDSTTALMEAGARVNAVSQRGMTILYEAVLTKDIALVKYLLSKGADPNRANPKNSKECTGIPPLIQAIELASSEMVKVLLDHGANPLARDPQGKTALDHMKPYRFSATFKDIYSLLEKANTRDSRPAKPKSADDNPLIDD